METPGAYDSVVKRYGRLASVYDRRWRAYLRQTLESTLDAMRLSGTERFLDVGCGTGEFERLALGRFPGLTVVGIDVTPTMITIARQKFADFPQAHFFVAQAEALPFDPEQFDVVVSANMLHHVRTPTQFLHECIRVLRPGGQFVLVDWCRDFWHCGLLHVWWKLTDRSYVRMYRLSDIARLLEELGLTLDGATRFIASRGYGMMRINAQKLVCAPT